jgi:hypothetical protein
MPAPKQWNLIGPSESAQPHLFPPSSIFPPTSSRCAFIQARKDSALWKSHHLNFSFKKCVGLKFLKLRSVLFSSVTRSRTPSTYILPADEIPNFTPIPHKGKIFVLYTLLLVLLDIKQKGRDSEPNTTKQSSNVICSLLLSARNQ